MQGPVPQANRSGRLPAPAMLGAALRALWARLRLHIHGWVVLRKPSVCTAGVICCCQMPQEKVSEGSESDKWAEWGQAVRWAGGQVPHQLYWGWGCLRTRSLLTL